jgi:thiopurine S-methyltransferase
MDRQYWLDRWREDRIGFHSQEVNPLLERFFPEVAGRAGGRALLPLCGKSLDLKWLAARGYTVVGVDLSEIAARAFFKERRMDFIESNQGEFKILQGERITFLVGDFFHLDSGDFGKFDFIYDRAAIIALPASDRKPYAAKLQSLLAPAGDLLLISLEYDPSQMEGPPFCVSESEIRELFESCAIEKLYDHDCLADEPRFQERGVTWLRETVFHVTRQQGGRRRR